MGLELELPRGVESVAEEDVYLTLSSMTAIWMAHQCLLGVGPEAKSVCFACAFFSLVVSLLTGILRQELNHLRIDVVSNYTSEMCL